MRYKHFWRGVPVERLEYLWCLVKFNRQADKWYNFECYDDINEQVYMPVLELTLVDGIYRYISNHCGVGVHVLEQNQGRLFEYDKEDFLKIIRRGEKNWIGRHDSFNHNCYLETEYRRALWQSQKEKGLI